MIAHNYGFGLRCRVRQVIPGIVALGIIATTSVAWSQKHSERKPPELLKAVEVKQENRVISTDEIGSLEGHWTQTSNRTEVLQYAADQAHAACFEDDVFPSAVTCAECHPRHFREWSTSPHAYAQMSPVFNGLFGGLNELTTGTVGDFCLRCHTPVGAALQEDRFMSNMDRHPAAREGITCVVCHRINQPWGKVSGRQALVAGGVDQVIFGNLGSEVLDDVMHNPDRYGVLKTSPDDPSLGRTVHQTSYKFFQLSTSGFCGACHDVLTPSGFRLEDAFSEYKASPAAREQHLSCQDCHMGKVQGAAAGYLHESVAMIGNVETPPRKRTAHWFAGPDPSVIHPGIFPHNPEAVREEGADELAIGLATMREWLQFDHKSDWGKLDFEDSGKDDVQFPAPWMDARRRIRARQILNQQEELLMQYQRRRAQVLSIGFKLDEVQDLEIDRDGIDFRLRMYSGTTGHGVPTGFDGERPIWLQVVVWDREGTVVFRSGDLDPNGDYRDDHSFYVHNGDIPRDRFLLTLQSKFVTRNVRGNEREDILPVPFSLDPISFNRPLVRPFSSLGRPLGARKHKQIIEPCGERWGSYHVDACNLTGKGPYQISARLVAGMVPVNLVHIVSFAGYDYGMSAREIASGIVAGHLMLHEKRATVHCHE